MVMVIGVMLRSGSLAESLVVTTVVLKHLATSIIDGNTSWTSATHKSMAPVPRTSSAPIALERGITPHNDTLPKVPSSIFHRTVFPRLLFLLPLYKFPASSLLYYFTDQKRGMTVNGNINITFPKGTQICFNGASYGQTKQTVHGY